MALFFDDVTTMSAVCMGCEMSCTLSLSSTNVFILLVNRAAAINIAHQMAPLHGCRGSARDSRHSIYCLVNIGTIDCMLPGVNTSH